MSAVVVSALLLFALIAGVTDSAYCSGKPDPNAQANTQGYYEANPQLLKTVENGELYLAGPPDQQMYLVHVRGSPYQMGYAQGALLTDVIIDFMDQVWQYIIDEMPFHTVFPELMNATLQDALAITADATQPWTPQYWYDEMQGLSDATGVSFDEILRIHMLPSLTQGHCSMFGASGNATMQSMSGKLLQLRALDWDTEGPFKDFPAMVVYHPQDGHAFANIAFTGFIGSITGVSSSRCSISEIGVSYPDATFGSESRFGYPFPFLLRDILQFDDVVADATKRMQEERRTCDLILGVGCGNDGSDGQFRGYEYSYSTLNVYDWSNLEPYNETWHPRINDIVYWGMDWLCPNFDIVLSNFLLKYYGEISSANAMTNIVAQTQTGDLHIAIYDYFQDAVYIGLHARSDQTNIPDNKRNAYDRPYLKFDLKDLFA